MNANKKFLTACLVFVLGVLALDNLVGLFFDQMLEKLPNEGERVAKSNYSLKKVEADLIVIGSSRAECHYDTEVLSKSFPEYTVYNCGGDGQGFLYCNVLLNGMVNRYTPKVVIWDMQFHELYKKKHNLSLLYPHYTHDTYIYNTLNSEEDVSFRLKMLLNSYRYNATSLRILRSVYTPSAVLENKKGFGPRPVRKNMIVPSEKGGRDADLDPNMVNHLQATIDKLHTKGIKLVIVMSPVFNVAENNNTVAKLEEICKENNVLFVNHSQLDGFVHNSDLFYDSNHLNSKGAEIFSETLVKQIKGFI